MKTFFSYTRNSLGIAAVCFAIGCGADNQSEQSQRDSRPHAVCTTGMITDLVSQVGGDKIRVTGLMGPGVDPHYYKASQGDIKTLSGAEIIFYNGLFLEGKMEDIFKKMGRSKTVVAVAETVDKTRLRRPAAFDGNFDPHIWFDVSLWKQTLPVVVATLSKVLPADSAFFQSNAAAYLAQLDSLHIETQKAIASIPAAQRVLVTAHDAFGYFGVAYDIEVVGLQGISTVAEFGVNDVSRLVSLVASRGIKAIFVESSVPQRSINAVREGCKARGFDVKIGGTLYSDAMGAAGTGADTYLGMVRSNVSTIVEALK